MTLLQKYLKKLGLKSYDDLNPAEKETYRTWEETLSGRRITDDDVKKFFQTEEDLTISKLITRKVSDSDDTFLKMKLEFLRKIQIFLAAPEMEKKAVEATINNQLN